MCIFLHTLSVFRRNAFVNPCVATLRHVGWQVRKIFNRFPAAIRLERFTVVVKDRSVANGCGGLVNAMGYYDPNNMYLVEELAACGLCATLFDVGANIGIYSLIGASAGHARVVAFEPHPATFAMLEENVLFNGLEQQIDRFRLALSNTTGRISFSDQPGSPINRIVDDATTASPTLTVDVTTGDAFCAQHGVRPDVIKIDVEGHEQQVLEGFAETLDHVGLVIVESEQLDRIRAVLCGRHGLRGPLKVDYRGRRFLTTFPSCEDHVFVSPAFLDRLRDRSFAVAD
jgi:FkbM family methyltransferase